MTSATVNIRIDPSDLERAIRRLQSTPREAQQALRATVTRMAQWLNTRVRRGMQERLRLRPKFISRRLVRSSVTSAGGQVAATVWIGMNPVSAIEFGGRQTRAGVRNRRGTYPSAFIMKVNNGSKKHIFKRETRARLPIEKVTEEIENEGRQVVNEVVLSGIFETEFLRVFERELTWRTLQRR